MVTRLLFRIIPTVVAMALGITTLLAVVLEPLAPLRALFITWASILAAFALLAGFLNVVAVHIRRIAGQQHNWPYSVALLLGVSAVIAVAVVDLVYTGSLDPGGPYTGWLFENVILQLEIAVAALVVFLLVYAAFRALQRPAGGAGARPVWGTLLFLLAALLVLLRAVSIATDETVLSLQATAARLFDSMALGGARGLLIGIALGTIATGLRLLAGADRPHSE